jgi:hypothetical protein
MKKKDKLIFLGIVIILLIVGWILFRLINGSVSFESVEGSFQVWVWENRSLDQAVQVLLVFAGALGIAAILPMEENDH